MRFMASPLALRAAENHTPVTRLLTEDPRTPLINPDCDGPPSGTCAWCLQDPAAYSSTYVSYLWKDCRASLRYLDKKGLRGWYLSNRWRARDSEHMAFNSAYQTAGTDMCSAVHAAPYHVEPSCWRQSSVAIRADPTPSLFPICIESCWI
jgi:hypothetical protein